MFSALGSWLLPLSFLPGIGLLLLSTSTRMASLDINLHRLLARPEHEREHMAPLYEKRLNLFRRIMGLLYLSIGLFALSSLVAALDNWDWIHDALGVREPSSLHTLHDIFTALLMVCMLSGVVTLLMAVGNLWREVHLSTTISQQKLAMGRQKDR